MLISFYCILAETFNLHFVLESLKSIIPVADEIVIIMGRIDNKNEIEKISDKIKIHLSHNWPITWSYDILIYHHDLALKACTGDFCIKWNTDWILNYKEEKNLKDILVSKKEFDKIFIPRYSYIDKYHWIIEKILILNRNNLLQKFGDEDAYFNGFKNNKVELITPENLNEFTYTGDLVKVFSYDSTFLQMNEYLNKKQQIYHALQLKLGNLSSIGINDKDISDLDKLSDVCLNNQRERIEKAMNENRICFNGINFHPVIMSDKIKNINKSHFGSNFFGKIDTNLLLYEKILPERNKITNKLNKIKRYLTEVDERYKFLNEFKTDKDLINAITKINKEIKISKFS